MELIAVTGNSVKEEFGHEPDWDRDDISIWCDGHHMGRFEVEVETEKAFGLEYNAGGMMYKKGIKWIPKSQVTFTEVMDLCEGQKNVSQSYSWVCVVPDWMINKF